jgi:hypothetical protein
MENQEQAQIASQDVGGEAPTEASPELTITDLVNIRAIIDVAVRRGAFGAAEASSVGAAFDRLNTFLNAVAPPAEQTAQAAE